MKEVNAESCAREQELVGFIYGELNEVEARGFQRHLNECAACSTEISNFKDVRETVVDWRNVSLGAIGVSAQGSPAPGIQRKPSALAAIREFLNLSPLWMKAAVAFATIVICVLAAIGVARLRNNQPQVIVARAAEATPSQQEIDAIVKQRVSEKLAEIKRSEESQNVATDDQSLSAPIQRVSARNPVYSTRRPLSKTERQQLAADLRLLSSNNDNDVDLLEDRINQ
jgi:hypothetical protein